MTPQELKNSILQLAIQGKLVEQRSEEGTGEELYRQILVEKKRLIKAGTIKQEKPLTEVTEDEKPLDIPESWMWVRLRTIVYNRAQEIPTSTFSYIDIGSINNKVQRLSLDENIVEAQNAPSRARRIVELGDILYSTVRPYLHNMCIIDRQFPYQPIASTGFAAMTCHDGVFNKYLFYYLMSQEFDGYANDTQNAKGVAYPAINDDRLYRAIVPLPPLAEQKRIVAKIEELQPYIDRYEQAWSKLEDFNKRFPFDMQKSLLQMAIQGKLVEQRPEEGTGEELYRHIQAEKQKLIKEGTIKNEKPLLDITEDEKPFDIPDSWTWVRMRDITENIGDGIHGTPEFELSGGFYFINGNNLDDGKVSFKADTQQVNESEYKKYSKPLTSNTVLISINGTLGNIAYYNNEPVILGKSACYIALIECVYKNYIRVLLESNFFLDYASREATQTTIKNVSLKAIRMLPVPLPPLAEQKRIVAKFEQLLPLCEKLK